MQYSQVFISYKSEDYQQADWLRSVLEQNGISCWMAPASIPGGSNYAKEIPRAIENCRVFVLVLTKRCQSSIWVPKELDRALNAHKPVMPFALEDCQLNDDFNFYLSNVQRYAAYRNKSDAVQQLLRDIRALLNIPQTQIQKPAKKKLWIGRNRMLLIGAVILGLLALPMLKNPGQQKADAFPDSLTGEAGVASSGAMAVPNDTLENPGELSAEDVAALKEKAVIFLRGKGIDRLDLYDEKGGNRSLSPDDLTASYRELEFLDKAYVSTDPAARNTLIVPFRMGLEGVPCSWVDNVYYEDPILVDYPAVYGYLTFPDLMLDEEGKLIDGADMNLKISAVYEREEEMTVDLFQWYPGNLVEGSLAKTEP